MNNTAYISSLVQKVRKNEVLAMQSLYEAYSKQMMATCHRITNNISDAEDIIQDAFLHSFKKIGQLKEDNRYGGWLKQIVVNASLKHVKRKMTFSPLEAVKAKPVEDEDNWYEGISFDLIKAAIQKLPNGSRQVFSLYLMEGYKHKEIAEALDISVSTSKSQYRYAIKLLRDNLTQYLNE